jgi:hypothetical protein
LDQSRNTPPGRIFRRRSVYILLISLAISAAAWSQGGDRTDTTGNAQPPFDPFSFPGALNADSLAQHARDSVQHFRDSVRARADSLGIPIDPSLGFGMFDSTLTDSSRLFQQIDTTWVVYLDSTAREQQMAYHRKDEPVVAVFPAPEKSIFLDVKSSAYRRELKIDSTGGLVTVTETVNGLNVKIPLTITIEEYIRYRFAEDRRKNWRSFIDVNKNVLQNDQLGAVLKSLTNISIPVPSNPLFSIFGGKDIKLNVSGAVDIRAGFRRTSSDKVTSSALDQVRNEPNFNQDVRVNVNGTIGDKLNILADWNTQRTFDFENQLKIKYTGYEDEIIKTIEAGNVSLRTPALIGGGQSLFGIKANMQLGPLNLTALVSQKKGQTKELSISGGSENRDVIINPSN